MNPKETALHICSLLDNKKAVDLQLLEVTHLTIIADYFVIATGRSTLQVKTLAGELEEKLGEKPIRVDGYAEARWIVMDYGSVLVHIFHEQEREFYHLERLWSDGNNSVALPEAEE